MKHKKIVTWLLSCICVCSMGAIASACSFGGEDSSVGSSSSSKAEISSSTPDETSSEEESSSTPDETSSEESSSMPDETSSEESSSTSDETSSEEESSSTPDETSSEESSSTPDESSVEDSSSTPDESSSKEDSSKPDESSSKEDSSKPDESSSKEDSSSDSSSESSSDTTQQYTLYVQPQRYIRSSPAGGSIYNADGVKVDFEFIKLAEGSSYTVTAKVQSNEYYFLGWYYAAELDDVTEENFISDETTYTFTIDKDLSVYAVFAYKEDPIKLTVEDSSISYQNGEPTLTLVKKGDTTFTAPDEMRVYGVFPTGKMYDYGMYKYTSYFKMNDGGFDISTVGTYTITYYYRYNENIKTTLVVQVVEDAHTLKISSPNSRCLEFCCNTDGVTSSTKKEFPTGRLVTLTAVPKDGYAFTGWYDENDVLVSDELIYIFEMPDADVTLYGRYESASKYLKIYVWNQSGELVDDLGNAYIMGDSWTIYFNKVTTVNLTVRAKGGYEFLGWYENTLDGASSTFLTMDKTISVTVDQSRYVEAKFNEKLQDIEIDTDQLSEEGFVDGTLAVAIGDDPVDYKNFGVKAVSFEGYTWPLDVDNYTVDGDVDFGVAGAYTVTYTYKGNNALTAKLKIVVVDPQTAQFSFARGYSYLDHDYNGKATFISLRDVKVGDVSLYEFKPTSKIWEKISYKWIDTATNEVVDTTDADITINGTVVKDYGPLNYKMTIGNEFGGPVKAGAYRFEFSYDGATVFTQTSTINTQIYQKITTSGDFKSNEGSMWLNFELYYYTIIGYADGKYYAMQMPSIGADNVEVEAREIPVDANGNAIVGNGNDFAFVNVRYYTNDYSGYTEFLTGYYGSYVARVSSDTTDGTMWGMPNIHRTGYTCISDGKIYREYGTKESYGMSTTFAENGAVTICSKNGSANGRLRLVKDGDKYVFTSVPADTDTRESYDIFLYRTIIDTTVEDTSNK